jgi:hypothetical protein
LAQDFRYPFEVDLSQHVATPSNVQNLHWPIVLSLYLAHLAQLRGEGCGVGEGREGRGEKREEGVGKRGERGERGEERRGCG